MNAFVVVFGIPVALGMAYALIRVADEWAEEGRRNSRRNVTRNWQEVCRRRGEFDSADWTGR